MTDWDQQWQERITKVVRRVARDLIANDESEISEVVRRRLFEDLGKPRTRKRVARSYADWCFERTARLPPEWLAVDTATTEDRAKEFLKGRFEACYPFHPATLSVFQRKWQALPQFQQTRGALAMLAQWISWASREQFRQARTEPLITLGSAPLHVPEFRAVVLGQLGETRLDVAIEADLAGPMAHARALDTDTKGALRDIHRRVGTAILFESSGGQFEKVAHLPELRFALGEPEVETTTVDSMANALEARSFFVRRYGTDGYRDPPSGDPEEGGERPARVTRRGNRGQAEQFAGLSKTPSRPVRPFRLFSSRRTVLLSRTRRASPWSFSIRRWSGKASRVVERVGRWTKERGSSPRLYPGSLVWCASETRAGASRQSRNVAGVAASGVGGARGCSRQRI